MKKERIPGIDGEKYITYDKRSGDSSVVYFTKDLSADGLQRIFERVGSKLEGKVCIKLHTGEKNGPNIIPRPWVKQLVAGKLPDATIIETNTYYKGDRYTTEQHRETLEVNGWTFCPVDILDEDGTVMLPVSGGKWFDEMSMGKNIVNYDSMLTLTHFKGHFMGGFGGSNKNIGIGCADGQIGKKMIHLSEETGNPWGVNTETLMERICESTKAVLDHFEGKVVYINVLRNMSVDCDCTGCAAAPVVTPNVGILASTDILAVDQASVDIVYAMKEEHHRDLIERIESRHGLRQLSYMKELGMGNDRYELLDIDNADAEILPKEIAKDLVPFKPFIGSDI